MSYIHAQQPNLSKIYLFLFKKNCGLTLCPLGIFFMFFVVCWFFVKINLFNNSYSMNSIWRSDWIWFFYLLCHHLCWKMQPPARCSNHRCIYIDQWVYKWCLLITLANRLSPDQAGQNIKPSSDPNCFDILSVFLAEMFKSSWFWKISRLQKSMQIYQEKKQSVFCVWAITGQQKV